MSLFTSTQFASAAASGTDWRDTSKTVLEKLEDIRTDGSDFNFGFLYITDHLVGDAVSILNLFRSVLQIEHWIGCVGIGICGNGESFVDQPAISAMIGHFDVNDFCVFPSNGGEQEQTLDVLNKWLEQNDPMLIYAHGDPLGDQNLPGTLKELERVTNGFVMGGLSSSRQDQIQFANGDPLQGGISGAVFSQNIPVATTLSQGCTPIGGVHNVTKADEHTIYELDSESAVSVFENDLRTMAIKKIDQDPDTILIDEEAVARNEIPDEFKSLFKGEVHCAFPVLGSDQKDYLVRNIIGLDPEEGTLTIAQNVSNGDTVMFVHRDENTVQQDLSKSLIDLRERITKDTGRFEPKGGLYVSCVARAFSEDQEDISQREMGLIKEVIGDIPLAGFYAGGEISKAQLYGYTGILTLFL